MRFPFIFTRENEPKPTALQKLPLRSDFCEPRRLPHPKPTFYVTQTTIPQFSLSSAKGGYGGAGLFFANLTRRPNTDDVIVMLPPRCCTNTKCGEISRHGERGEVSADSLTFPFLQGLVSSHPLFLSGEFLVLLFRDKSTKKRLCRGETLLTPVICATLKACLLRTYPVHCQRRLAAGPKEGRHRSAETLPMPVICATLKACLLRTHPVHCQRVLPANRQTRQC